MIGERLADLRKDKGMNQSDLANELNVSVHTISNYEQEKSTPDDETKKKIAALFNVSLDYLLGLVDEQRPVFYAKVALLPENLPLEAIKEIKHFIEYIDMKYK